MTSPKENSKHILSSLDWSLIAIVSACLLAAVAIVGIAAAEQHFRTDQYLGYCMAEGGSKSGCMMRWIEVKHGYGYGSRQANPAATIK